MSFDIAIVDKKLKLDKSVTSFAVLADYPVKHKLLAEVVRSEMSNLRGGNAHVKTRAEVRGGGRKPWKQKGTGRARHGSRRSPIWVGGGVAWGPRNDVNWHLKINKTAKIAALKSILKDRLVASSVYQLEKGFEYAKTKEAAVILTGLSDKTKNTIKNMILVYSADDKAMLNGFPNTDVKMINVNNLKIHKLVAAKNLILTPNALEALEKRLEA